MPGKNIVGVKYPQGSGVDDQYQTPESQSSFKPKSSNYTSFRPSPRSPVSASGDSAHATSKVYGVQRKAGYLSPRVHAVDTASQIDLGDPAIESEVAEAFRAQVLAACAASNSLHPQSLGAAKVYEFPPRQNPMEDETNPELLKFLSPHAVGPASPLPPVEPLNTMSHEPVYGDISDSFRQQVLAACEQAATVTLALDTFMRSPKAATSPGDIKESPRSGRRIEIPVMMVQEPVMSAKVNVPIVLEETPIIVVDEQAGVYETVTETLKDLGTEEGPVPVPKHEEYLVTDAVHVEETLVSPAQSEKRIGENEAEKYDHSQDPSVPLDAPIGDAVDFSKESSMTLIGVEQQVKEEYAVDEGPQDVVAFSTDVEMISPEKEVVEMLQNHELIPDSPQPELIALSLDQEDIPIFSKEGDVELLSEEQAVVSPAFLLPEDESMRETRDIETEVANASIPSLQPVFDDKDEQALPRIRYPDETPKKTVTKKGCFCC